MKRLTVRGHVSTFTGYGQMLCEIVSRLDELGVYCSIRPIEVVEPWGATVPMEIKSKFVSGVQPEPWEILIRSPWELPTPRKKTIYYTMWESTILPKEYVEMVNKAEVVVVPSHWNKTGFEQSGVKVPVAVVPLGYCPNIFSSIPSRLDGPFVVGVAGRPGHGHKRKGIDRAIDIFQKAFPDGDVQLRVKVHPDDNVMDVKDPRIIVDKAHFTWAQMREWFASLDLFLSLSLVEGFGLLQLQAMACSRPLMAASYAGMTQFVNESNSFCLPFKEVKNSDYGGGLWAEIDEDSAIDQLRSCYRNRAVVRSKGMSAAGDALSFTWDKSVTKLYRLLLDLGVFR